MATTAQKPELIVIVGPTASGKSELALKVAQQFNGEIITADSRTVYRGMDIGTAKPTKEEQSLVPHWGINLIDPGQAFSAFEFKNHAEQKISEIGKRGRLPILVGGSGLYIDAVLFDFGFIDAVDPKKRAQLEAMTTGQLKEHIKKQNYPMPENENNRRHLIRTIERKGEIGSKRSIKDNTLIIGLLPQPTALKERIFKRANSYFANGLLQETENLLYKYNESAIIKTHGIAYIASLKLLKHEVTEEQALEMLQKHEWQYARRQRTWFSRNKFIRWFSSKEQAYKEIVRNLNN